MRMENDHGKAMQEVMRGYEFAEQLRQLLLKNNNNNNNNNLRATTSTFVQHLVNNIINSFNNVLFLLNKYIPADQIPKDFSSIDQVVRSVDFKESCKSTSAARGCNRKRNTTQQTWDKMTQTPDDDDGHQWRKYGKKKISNSPYLRNYYRCTHKYDQRCLTTKHVHRIQHKPPLYKTTYYGRHTCGNLPNPDITLDPNDTSSLLLSFNNTFPTPTKQECPFLSSSLLSLSSSPNSVEYNEEVPSSSLDDNNLPSPDPTLDDFISTRHLSTQSSTLEYDQKDMMYGFLYDHDEFDDDFLHSFGGF